MTTIDILFTFFQDFFLSIHIHTHTLIFSLGAYYKHLSISFCNNIQYLFNSYILFHCVDTLYHIKSVLYCYSLKLLSNFISYKQCWYPCIVLYSYLIITKNNSQTNILPDGPGSIISPIHAIEGLFPHASTNDRYKNILLTFLPAWQHFNDVLIDMF